MSLVTKALLAWLLLLVVMFSNGVVRVAALQPWLGESVARQLASLVGIVIVFVAAALFVRVAGRATTADLLLVGCLWVALTLAFEFGFGHYVAGSSWETLLEDYNVLDGRLWVFVLLATLVAPAVCGVLRARRTRKARDPV